MMEEQFEEISLKGEETILFLIKTVTEEASQRIQQNSCIQDHINTVRGSQGSYNMSQNPQRNVFWNLGDMFTNAFPTGLLSAQQQPSSQPALQSSLRGPQPVPQHPQIPQHQPVP